MILKNSISGKSSLILSADNAIISAGPNSFSSTTQSGNFINGPVSISSPFTKIRMGGIYKFNSLLANTIPSTVITPIPTLEIDLPAPEAAGLIAITSMVLSIAAG